MMMRIRRSTEKKMERRLQQLYLGVEEKSLGKRWRGTSDEELEEKKRRRNKTSRRLNQLRCHLLSLTLTLTLTLTFIFNFNFNFNS